MTIKVGVIGASFAKAAYLPALKYIEDVEILAISSFHIESSKNCAEEFNISNYYDNWEKMLEKHRFDLVCIATPTDLHAPITIRALDKGAHVLTEKPTAMNAEEARQMLDRATELNKIHQVNLNIDLDSNN